MLDGFAEKQEVMSSSYAKVLSMIIADVLAKQAAMRQNIFVVYSSPPSSLATVSLYDSCTLSTPLVKMEHPCNSVILM